MSLADIDVAILCGGKGTRAKSYLGDTPKVLVPINGKPCIEHVVSHLQYYGARNFHFLAGPYQKRISEWWYGACLPLRAEIWFHDDEQLGVGLALSRLSWGQNTLLVVNGDTLLRGDIAKLVERIAFPVTSFTVKGIPSGVVLVRDREELARFPMVSQSIEVIAGLEFLDIGTLEGYSQAEAFVS